VKISGIVSIFIILIFVAAFAACGSAPAPAPASPPVEEAPPPPPPPPPPPAEEAPPPPPPPSDDPISLNVSFEPALFSPDGDGENDQLSILLGVSGGQAASWTFDILQPEVSGSTAVFKHFGGDGAPPARQNWDGRSDRQEPVQSATDYPYVFTVTEAGRKVSEPVTGKIQVDVLVTRTRDGRLQIQVPSIVFRSNAADFENLPASTIRNNERVGRRIAAILNKFPDYKVQVEGHANPVSAPGTAARTAEEERENASGAVSEQRAQLISRMLVAAGVDGSRLSATGKGISSPVVDYNDRDNWWQNRRVEFYLEK
jgi:outer membrane protein OmpA-like peptidoglycan-associated protein